MKCRITPEGFCFALLLMLAAFVYLCTSGCKSSTQIVLTDSTSVTVGSFCIGDVPIPTVAYQTGPRFFAATRDGAVAGFWCKGGATITNETHALGIYDSVEVKNLVMEARADTSVTNGAPVVE